MQLLQLIVLQRVYNGQRLHGMGQPSSRVLVRFLLEGSTGPVQSFWYCIEQGNFSRLCGPMAQRSPHPRKSPCTMENMEAADTGEPMTQRCFKAAVAHCLPSCSARGDGWVGQDSLGLGSCLFLFEICLPGLPNVDNAGQLL